MNMTKEERERLKELHNAVYNAKDQIECEFTTGMYGNKFPGLNDMHEKVLYLLRDYNTFLNSLLN